jgi:hypothetical protein
MTLALAVAVFNGCYSIDPGGGVKPGGLCPNNIAATVDPTGYTI